MTDQQKVWETLRSIYGMDLTAATLVVLTYSLIELQIDTFLYGLGP